MPVAVGPLETIINVKWASGGIYVLLNFLADGTDEVVVEPKLPGSRVEFSYRKVTKPEAPLPSPGDFKRHWAWHIQSPAYITGNLGGFPPKRGPIFSGYTGCTSVDQALTGRNLNGVPQGGLAYEYGSADLAKQEVASRNKADEEAWALYVANPGDGGFLRHWYDYGITPRWIPKPEIGVTTNSIFVVKVPRVELQARNVIEFATGQESSLGIWVYPAKDHIVYPKDKSGKNGEPAFPIRLQVAGAEKPPPGKEPKDPGPPNTALWIMKATNALPFGRRALFAQLARWKELNLSKIVELYTEQFRYDVLSYRTPATDKQPDGVLTKAPKMWTNLIGPPPIQPLVLPPDKPPTGGQFAFEVT